MKDILVHQTAYNPLQAVTNEFLLKQIINPMTNKPYNGIILFGEFISFGVLNNNNRVYNAQNYLPYIDLLKKSALSSKGLYGELEHPKDYPINYNNVSHKIIDLFYDEQNNRVVGYVLLLDTPKGKIAQEIIKSGGQLGISARAAGKENQNPDGTLSAEISLLITFDLVNHPGFTSAIMGFQNHTREFDGFLNESITYPVSSFDKFRKLFETESNINNQQQEVMQDNQSSNEKEVENQLQTAVDKELKESEFEYEEDKNIHQIFESIKMKQNSFHITQRNLGINNLKRFL